MAAKWHGACTRAAVFGGLLIVLLAWPAGGIQASGITDAGGAAPAGPAAVPDPPDVTLITRSGSNATLEWTSAGDCTAYEVWRGVTPYFEPAANATNKIAELENIYGEGQPVPYTDNGIDYFAPYLAPVTVIGNVQINYFWVVRGRNGGSVSGNSNRVGEFDYKLVPGS